MPGSLDPEAVWQTVAAEGVNLLTVVGDAVARPLLDAWDRAGGYDVPSLFSVSNGGAPMAPATRERIFATLPDDMVTDGFGSSETGTQGASGCRPGRPGRGEPRPLQPADQAHRGDRPGRGRGGARFRRGRPVLAGGHLPLGYYNDPERTAETFVERDGERWLITGDMATVEADGAIELLGRGSQRINTGGEKVFPEEVESVLKAHPAVYDCLVVGVPDERWGSAVTAVVQPAAGVAVTLEDLATHVKGSLAGYKAPKHLVVVDAVVRSPSGKADYRWARDAAGAALGHTS